MLRLRNLVVVLSSFCVLHTPTPARAQDKADVKSRVARQKRFANMTEAQLKAEGRNRAEIEYAEDSAEIESYGLRAGWLNIDKATGLYIRDFGCVIMNNEDVESNAYNERLRELVAEKGPPANAKGVKERLQRLQRLMENAPQLTWKDVPWTPSQENAKPLTLGQFTIQAEIVRNPARDAAEERYRRMEKLLGNHPQNIANIKHLKEALEEYPENVARVRIVRGSNLVANVRMTKGQSIKAALLADLDILALKIMLPMEEIIFVDMIHGRVLWRYHAWWKELRKRLQELPQERAHPDVT